jgi:glycosyltransferase involved in cell wall biosynthesis
MKSFPFYYKIIGNKRLLVINNGVDYDRINSVQKTAKINKNNNMFRIIIVGRLIDIKQPMIVLDAFNSLAFDNSELIIIGDGPMKKSLKNRSGKNTYFYENMTREEVYRQMAKANLFISMSITEGFPVATLEAIASGLPVILSDINAHREIASCLKYSKLVPLYDIDLLMNEICRFINMNKSERKIIGEVNNSVIRSRYSNSKMLSYYNDHYNFNGK